MRGEIVSWVLAIAGLVVVVAWHYSTKRVEPTGCWDAPLEALDADELQWVGLDEGTPMVCARFWSLAENRNLGTARRSLVRCWPAKPMPREACRQVPPIRKDP